MSRKPPQRPPGRAAAPAVRRGQRPLLLGMSLTLLCLWGVALYLGLQAHQASSGAVDPAAPARLATDDACRVLPAFLQTLGLPREANVYLSTSSPDRVGLVLLAEEQATGRTRGYQAPNGTWDDAGHLGSYITDRDGAIYVPPIPRVSLAENPPERATTIWRVDPQTQVMAPWATIPAAVAPSTSNPFGVMGLAYACTTDAIYATSVAGSTRAEERGVIVRIDRATAAVTALHTGLDALGLAVVREEGAPPRLYVGAAREGLVLSFALDDAGGIVGAPRQELDLLEAGANEDARARRIGVNDAGELLVYAVPFRFNLAAQSEREEVIYRYAREGEGWRLVGAEPRAAASYELLNRGY